LHGLNNNKESTQKKEPLTRLAAEKGALKNEGFNPVPIFILSHKNGIEIFRK
jgi:hypothetical protein